MFEELETVILKRDIAEYGLRAGDMGAVVNTYEDGKTALMIAKENGFEDIVKILEDHATKN